MKNVMRPLAAAVIGSSILLTGCIGKFALTDKIYTWNKKVDSERWVNEGVFLAFVFVQVYTVTVFADAVIFNSIDWWTGKNPIAAGDTREVKGEDGSVAQMTLRADGAIDVAVTAAGGQQSEFTLVREGDTVHAQDKSGQRLDVVTF